MREKYVIEYCTRFDNTQKFYTVVADDRQEAKDNFIRCLALEYHTGTGNIKAGVIVKDIYERVKE